METDKSIFMKFLEKNQKCIINADLDGLLSGMLLQQFLDWTIVGFSDCSGKKEDDLWLFDEKENLEECIFVDLPVHFREWKVIDQHFIAFDETSIKQYQEKGDVLNPNILRQKVFPNEYTNKYPFGTFHFLLAALESIGIIPKDFELDYDRALEEFDVADLVLRADRVVGNTFSYTENCMDWMEWLCKWGGQNTKNLFEKVKNEILKRKGKETKVEEKMKSFECSKDGNCAALFVREDYKVLENYFIYLAKALNMKPLPIQKFYAFGKLEGKRYQIEQNLEQLKEECSKENLFSYAFISKSVLSVTYIKEDS